MIVHINKIGEEIPEGADYAIYRVARDEAIVLTRRLEGEWTRDARLQILLMWHLVDGIQANKKSVWDLDNQRFIAGTKRQKSFVPAPKPVIVEVKPEPKNKPQGDRNAEIWRLSREHDWKNADIGRKFGISGGRIHELLMRYDRMIKNAVHWGYRSDCSIRPDVMKALDGVEIVHTADHKAHLVFPNGKEFKV